MVASNKDRDGGARLRSAAAHCAMALASIAVGYSVLALVFFRVLLPNVQLNVWPYLPDMAGVLVQTSKAQFVPKDYVALLGDSNAEGLGDWLLSRAGNEAMSFHSAHVIREMTGRDVVSFAKGGSGSAEGLVRQPARIMAGSGCAIFPTLEHPKRILVYFYEGNDIEDNFHFGKKVGRVYRAQGAAEIDRYLDEEYGTFAGWRCHLYLGDVASRMVSFIARSFFSPLVLSPKPPGGNAFVVAGKPFQAPDSLQGPALSFDDAQIVSGAEVFDRSLAWLRGHFKSVPATVVYIPAPLSVYRVAADADAAKITRNSNRICNLVRDASLRHDSGFIDARPALKTAAATRLIHGPVDWDHFNKDGYLVLGGLLAQRIQQTDAADSCN